MLRTKIEQIGNALCDVTEHVYHYWRPVGAVPCLIWAEEGATSLKADNGTDGQSIRGTADYFTKTLYDPGIDRVQAALEALGAAWSLDAVQYESDTKLIHYSWGWEVL